VRSLQGVVGANFLDRFVDERRRRPKSVVHDIELSKMTVSATRAERRSGYIMTTAQDEFKTRDEECIFEPFRCERELRNYIAFVGR